MRLQLDFDQTGVEVDLPDSLRATVLRSRFGTEIESPDRAIAEALQNPIGGLSAFGVVPRRVGTDG